jgi:hypothetical protein
MMATMKSAYICALLIASLPAELSAADYKCRISVVDFSEAAPIGKAPPRRSRMGISYYGNP